MKAAAPGRLRPDAVGLRQATASPRGLAVSGLSPKQGPAPRPRMGPFVALEGRSPYSASGEFH